MFDWTFGRKLRSKFICKKCGKPSQAPFYVERVMFFTVLDSHSDIISIFSFFFFWGGGNLKL